MGFIAVRIVISGVTATLRVRSNVMVKNLGVHVLMHRAMQTEHKSDNKCPQYLISAFDRRDL